jgi:hypothetical protein
MKPGDRVRVQPPAFEGVITHVNNDNEKSLSVKGGAHQMHYAVHPNTVTVLPKAPYGWPPLPGDVWNLDGTLYFCQKCRDNGIFDRILNPADGYWPSYDGDDGFAEVLQRISDVKLEYRS